MIPRIIPSLLTAALVAACSMDPSSAPISPSVRQGDVEYRATTLVMESYPVQLNTTVTMQNRTSRKVTVELGGGCPVLLRAYREAARSKVAWDQGQGLACTKEIQIVDLAPGDSAKRSTGASAANILGDSLPNGHYFLSAFVQVVGSPVTVPAGEADLAVPR